MKILKFLILLAVQLCVVQCSYANLISQTIVLNKGELLTVDSVLVPYYAFNKDTVFSQSNSRLLIEVGDTLSLSVFNNTSTSQQFEIEDFAVKRNVAASSTEHFTVVGNKAGVFVYSAGKSGNQIDAWGASGMFVIAAKKDAGKAKFYWNVKEFETKKVVQLDSGKTVDWSDYYPDYFLVNGLGKDQLVGDVISNVKGAVGESILIMVANTGRVTHSIHFHGYHCIAQEVNSTRVQKGSSKDTFPLSPGDGIILLLIPDKSGIYPVHDHNLIAVSGGGKYPNGIFMVLDIK